MKRYQITRLDPQTGTGVDGMVGADLTWEQALQRMAGADMSIDYALASLEFQHEYSFLEADGSLYLLTEHTVDIGPNGK